jgi:hypothetical protein
MTTFFEGLMIGRQGITRAQLLISLKQSGSGLAVPVLTMVAQLLTTPLGIILRLRRIEIRLRN